MNVAEAIAETGRPEVLEKLEELALASGTEGSYAVDRYKDGSVNVALLDEQGQNVEIGLSDGEFFNVAMWFARGYDTSLNVRATDLDQAAFEELIDNRIAQMSYISRAR
jgi:hypothetical protein